MNGLSGISAKAQLVAALVAAMGIPAANLAAEPFSRSSGTLSIGLPQNTDNSRGLPIDLTPPSEEGLLLEYNLGQFSLQGGRISPDVGIYWDNQRTGGVPAAVGPDRKAKEKVDVSAGVRFAPENLGSHRLTGGTTFLDLSSFANDRNPEPADFPDTVRQRRALGTEPTGFRLLLEGGKLPIAPDLSYRLGFLKRADGIDPAREEAGFRAGLANRFEFGAGLSLTPSIETAHMSNGSDGRDYFAASMMTEWRNWNLTLSYGRRDGDGSAASLIDSFEGGASIGYVFDSGVSADLGWERQKTAEDIADHIGFQFKYQFGLGR